MHSCGKHEELYALDKALLTTNAVLNYNTPNIYYLKPIVGLLHLTGRIL